MNLSKNHNLLPSKMSKQLVDSLLRRDIPLRLALNSIPGTTEDDLNIFRTISCIVGLELNDAALNLGKI